MVCTQVHKACANYNVDNGTAYPFIECHPDPETSGELTESGVGASILFLASSLLRRDDTR